MLIVILTVLALQDAAAPAPPQATAEARGPVIENPSWIRYPRINFHRSTRDRSGGVPEGRAIVRCIATVEGRLEDCAVVSDSSISNRLSPYALRAANDALIRPKLVDGQPEASSVEFSVGVAPR